ncbi:MAG: PQQ-binding-like beta-propeller repeat protein [Planctomycetota bacterium]
MPACLLALASLLLLCVTLPGQSTDWPQFRGPDGLAVQDGAELPVDFGPASPALAWKVATPGEGISSPIVSRGRVFLTTARSNLPDFIVAAMLGLAGFFLLLQGWRVLRPREARPEPEEGSAVRLLRGLDRLAIALTSLGFLALALVATFEPTLLWTPGVPGDVWIITSGVALAGLVACFGSLRPSSLVRILAILVLGAAAAFILAELPLNKHREPYRLLVQAAMVSPALAGSCWFLFLFLFVVTRRSKAAALPNSLSGLLLAPMAGLLFLNSNYWQPGRGLERAVLAFDAETGDALWDTPLFVAPEERLHRVNSFATPTPCSDGEYVFAYVGSGYACLDFEGRVLWDGRDEEYHKFARYGSASSPIPFEETFIVLQENEQYLRGSYIMALDKKTGRPRWRIEPQYAHDSYMTPSLIPVGDSTQLLTVTYRLVVSYDPRSGDKLWSLEIPIQQMVPSLVYTADLLLVSGGAHNKWLTAGLRLSGSGKDTKADLLWQTRRGVPDTPSPVLLGGRYFTVTRDGGIMTCFEPASGKVIWKERLGGTYLASLVAGDGKVYACTEEGDVVVVEAGPEFKLVQRSRLGERIRATPALANGSVFIRGDKHLYCFEKAGRR